MITSTSNNQVKHIINLNKKAKERKTSKEFVVEGIRMVKEAPKERIVKVYVSENYYKDNEKLILDLINDDKLEIVDNTVFCKMSDTQTPQGIMAVVAMENKSLEDIVSVKNTNKDLSDNKIKAPLLICLENLQDPGNLGTIIRMAEGAGATGVIMSSNTVDVYNPKTIRSTMGSLYRVPFVYVEDFYETISKLKDLGINTYAAHLKGENVYTGPDFTKPTAFLIGNEGNGLTDKASALASSLIKIPMEGEVESLNAAIATTILSYEALRQRL
ncbi:TrmH family RNA methyltransferase [Lachnospira sp.]|uniref:TrmH family RNA methyltransferase n=1 Tax=Lachnospira sp. TaxID=2049031 RepID=UPI00257FA638|nr:RNA methyltransferase [Lachnospira sp.]